MKKKVYIFLFSLVNLLLFNFSAFSQSNMLNDTIKITTKLTKQHLMLPSVSNIIYILPPDKSFDVDKSKGSFGLVSDKYDASMLFTFQNDLNYDDVERMKSMNNIEKYELLRCNDVNIKYFKLQPHTDNSKVSWMVFCNNDFFDFYGLIYYDKKYDKVLSSKIEKSFRSIIVTRNPNVKPENGAYMTGDFSLLDLKFVQKLTFPISYFTEDGIPVKTTRGSKIVALTTYPLSSAQAVNDMAEPAIDMFNKVLQQQFPHDSIIAHKVYEEDFIGHDGICVEGSLKSDNSKHFLGLYSQGRSAFYVMLAICNEDETETFFRTVRKFKPTVKPTLE